VSSPAGSKDASPLKVDDSTSVPCLFFPVEEYWAWTSAPTVNLSLLFLTREEASFLVNMKLNPTSCVRAGLLSTWISTPGSDEGGSKTNTAFLS